MELPAESDVSLEEHLIRTHCPVQWPEGRRHLNCHNKFPGQSNEWAYGMLTAAGWSKDAILKLDIRTGPWS